MQCIARSGPVVFAFLAIVIMPCARAQEANQALTAATAQLRAGHYDAAIEIIHHAPREHPTDPRLHTVEGLAYSLKGDDEHALLSLRAALRIKPKFPAALKAEAEILTREQSPEAAPVLLRILEADPQDTTAREMLALEQAHEGNATRQLQISRSSTPHWTRIPAR